MRDAGWSWEMALASPAFWASYYELFLDDEDDEDDEDDLDSDEDDDDDFAADRRARLAAAESARARGTAQRFFGADPARPRDFDHELHNYVAASSAHYRKLLDAASGDLDAALERLLDDPFAALDPDGARVSFRASLELAREPAPPNKELVIPLAGGFMFVIEFVPGATRFCLDEGGVRVLLGHLSGHHALPALRWEEVFAMERIADRALAGSFLSPYVGLLLYATPWTAPGDDLAALQARVRAGVHRAGVVRPSEEDAFVELLTAPITDLDFEPPAAPGSPPGFAWWKEEPLGWVNNSPYGPRNPRSLFSRELSAVDGFTRIARWEATLDVERA